MFYDDQINDTLHYKILIRLKEIIKNKTPHLLIYGVPKSGKSFSIQYILNNLFGKCKIIQEDKVSFKENKYYYIFNLSNKTNAILCLTKIRKIINHYDHYNNNIKYIVLEDFNLVQKNIQDIIKSYIEHFFTTSRFIFITNNLPSIHKSILHSCLFIRIPLPTKYDKFIYFKSKLIKEKKDFNNFLLLKKCDMPFNSIMYDYFFSSTPLYYKNIYDESLENIFLLFNKPFNLNSIKNLSMRIKELNLNIERILSVFILKNHYDLQTNHLLIKEISDYDNIFKHSYRDIISIDSLLINLFKIIRYG